MAERPNALALKASVGKTTGGSNPSASAESQALEHASDGALAYLLELPIVLWWVRFGLIRCRSGCIECWKYHHSATSSRAHRTPQRLCSAVRSMRCQVYGRRAQSVGNRSQSRSGVRRLANCVIADSVGTIVEVVPHLVGANRRPAGQRGRWVGRCRRGQRERQCLPGAQLRHNRLTVCGTGGRSSRSLPGGGCRASPASRRTAFGCNPSSSELAFKDCQGRLQ